MKILVEFGQLIVKGAGIFFAAVGVINLIQLPSYFRAEVAFETNKASTIGTVVKVREEIEYSGGGIAPLTKRLKYLSTVRFQTSRGDIGKFTTSIVCSNRKNCVGKSVRVEYDPNSLDQARVATEVPINTKVMGRGAIYLVFILVGISFLIYTPKK